MSPNLASLFLFATSASSVDPVRRSLSAHSDQMFFWLVVASTVTGLGVILEAPAELRELRRWWRLRRLNKTVGWRVPITFVGLLLVICGIVGEGIFEFLSANAETNIRAYDEKVLGDTIVEAGGAKDSAAGASLAAQAAKTASSDAIAKATKASEASAKALIEANTFERDIISAKESAASAESHLAEALQRAAKAESEIAASQTELARLTGPPYLVPVINGVATPDLSFGFVQQIVMRGNVRINAPRLPAMPKGGAITWSLLIDQDSVGGHDPTILFAPSLPNKLFWSPSTRSTFEYITDDKGHTTERSLPMLGRPIETDTAKK